MEWTPALKLGWLNGWLMLASFYLVFGVLMLVFPKDVVAKLFAISGWTRRQRVLWAAGKPFTFSCLGLIVFTPLKIGRDVFVIGSVLFGVGFVGMIVSLFNFRNTPVDRPVRRGLYRVSRNPQWVSLASMFVGTCVAIGSWTALLLFSVAAVFYHFRIRGEERACLESYGESYREYVERVPRYFLFF